MVNEYSGLFIYDCIWLLMPNHKGSRFKAQVV